MLRWEGSDIFLRVCGWGAIWATSFFRVWSCEGRARERERGRKEGRNGDDGATLIFPSASRTRARPTISYSSSIACIISHSYGRKKNALVWYGRAQVLPTTSLRNLKIYDISQTVAYTILEFRIVQNLLDNYWFISQNVNILANQF